MIYIAACCLLALVTVSFAWAGLVRGLIRQNARERDLLINQICHLSGHTWAPPPAAEPAPPPEDEQEYDFGLTGPVAQFEYD